MNPNLILGAIIFVCLVFLNRMLAVPQQIRLNKDLVALKKRGPVSSVALSKSLAGVKVAVLIADKNGGILEAYQVSGKWITCGYQLDSKFPYGNCFEAVKALSNRPRLTNQEKAYLSAANFLKNGLAAQAEPKGIE